MKKHKGPYNTLAIFGMISAMGIMDVPHERSTAHLLPHADLSDDDIRRIKERVASERAAKRKRRGKK